MSDTPQDESHRRPHAPPTAGPFMEFDLPAEIHRLHAETTWSTGHNARTLIKYDDFRVVLTALQASTRVPEHKTEGRISVHVLSGHIQVRASGRTFSLRPAVFSRCDQGVPKERPTTSAATAVSHNFAPTLRNSWNLIARAG
jgi:quercetin dioxygenase-like cupin family protein